jgi:ribosomal protein S18 acetylase RimI-like enzyme
MTPGESDAAGAISIEAATRVDADLVDAVARLVSELSPSASPPTAEQLREIMTSTCTTLLLARDLGAPRRIVGMLALTVFRVPTGVHAWIDDVAVDQASRGRGVGAALTRAAIERATARGAAIVDLTSRPMREAANRLYRKLGFQVRDTNVYRFVPSATR